MTSSLAARASSLARSNCPSTLRFSLLSARARISDSALPLSIATSNSATRANASSLASLAASSLRSLWRTTTGDTLSATGLNKFANPLKSCSRSPPPSLGVTSVASESNAEIADNSVRSVIPSPPSIPPSKFLNHVTRTSHVTRATPRPFFIPNSNVRLTSTPFVSNVANEAKSTADLAIVVVVVVFVVAVVFAAAVVMPLPPASS